MTQPEPRPPVTAENLRIGMELVDSIDRLEDSCRGDIVEHPNGDVVMQAFKQAQFNEGRATLIAAALEAAERRGWERCREEVEKAVEVENKKWSGVGAASCSFTNTQAGAKKAITAIRAAILALKPEGTP